MKGKDSPIMSVDDDAFNGVLKWEEERAACCEGY